MKGPQTLYHLAPANARDLAPPSWTARLGERFRIVTQRVENVASLSPEQVEAKTFDAYEAIRADLSAGEHRHPVRFWNHVPFITDPADAGRDNYMVFNAGRFRALSSWFGRSTRFEREIATASATGHWGRDIVIHCLAADSRGIAVNNPRQVAPYHYSQRFGPLPPCFARATRLSHPPGLLLVGGTASVRGEDSVHAGDLPAQCRETFVNLAALICAARETRLEPAAKLPPILAAFTDLRIYFPDRGHEAEITAAIKASFLRVVHLEMFHADLCRPELLVEIEGVAELE